MAKIDVELANLQKHIDALGLATINADAEGMYEHCRAALGLLSKLLARFAVLMDLRQEASFAAEVDRALNRSK